MINNVSPQTTANILPSNNETLIRLQSLYYTLIVEVLSKVVSLPLVCLSLNHVYTRESNISCLSFFCILRYFLEHYLYAFLLWLFWHLLMLFTDCPEAPTDKRGCPGLWVIGSWCNVSSLEPGQGHFKQHLLQLKGLCGESIRGERSQSDLSGYHPFIASQARLFTSCCVKCWDRVEVTLL